MARDVQCRAAAGQTRGDPRAQTAPMRSASRKFSHKHKPREDHSFITDKPQQFIFKSQPFMAHYTQRLRAPHIPLCTPACTRHSKAVHPLPRRGAIASGPDRERARAYVPRPHAHISAHEIQHDNITICRPLAAPCFPSSQRPPKTRSGHLRLRVGRGQPPASPRAAPSAVPRRTRERWWWWWLRPRRPRAVWSLTWCAASWPRLPRGAGAPRPRGAPAHRPSTSSPGRAP